MSANWLHWNLSSGQQIPRISRRNRSPHKSILSVVRHFQWYRWNLSSNKIAEGEESATGHAE
jgi:hypothetical protein